MNPPCHNDSAMFGHCPPENDLMVKLYGANVESISHSNAQDCSDFASNTFKQAATISQDDHSLNSYNEEASMDVVMFSSKGEDMILF